MRAAFAPFLAQDGEDDRKALVAAARSAVKRWLRSPGCDLTVEWAEAQSPVLAQKQLSQPA